MWEGELDTSLVLLHTFLFYSMEGKAGGTWGNGADERVSNFTWQVLLWSVPLLQSNVPDGQYCLLMNVVQCIFVNWSLLKSGKVCCNHHTHEQLVHTMLMYTIKWRKKVRVLHIFDTHALFVLAFWVLILNLFLPSGWMQSMMVWLWGLNMYGFLQARIPYGKVFDLEYDHLTNHDIWKVMYNLHTLTFDALTDFACFVW